MSVRPEKWAAPVRRSREADGPTVSPQISEGGAFVSPVDVRRPVIAMDGPGGAGKSTIARRVAERLDFMYIDTGAMYRAVAWAVLRDRLAPDRERLDAAAITRLAESLAISFQRTGRDQRVRADGLDITAEIRTPEVERLVPRIAELPGVRRALVPQQRRLAAAGGVVMDGRDVGTAILPNADFKFYVTAALSVRAQRRYAELRRRGERVDLEAVTESLRERDDMDQRRAEGPLRQAPDAMALDTTDMTIDGAVERVIRACVEAGGHLRPVVPHAGGDGG